MAICSARGDAGAEKKNGINYLLSIKRQGIITPLSSEYEQKILEQTGTLSLEGAFTKIRDGYA